MAAPTDDPQRLDELMMPDSGGELVPVDWDIAIGDVDVRSAHGSLHGTARIDSTLCTGTMVVPTGFSEPNVGHLSATDIDIDPLTGMPTLVGTPVSVRPRAAGRSAYSRSVEREAPA
jgi:hypothetical protein